MCLGVPGRVLSITDDAPGVRMGRVQFGGVHKDVCLSFLPEIQPGDWVIVHAGFAISQIDEAEAAATFELLRGLADSSDMPDSGPGAGGDALR
jgi:hydrogenase expression/formation protein HypC